MRFLLSRRLLLKFREKRRTWKRGGVGGQAAEKSAECPIAQLPAYDAPLSAEHAPGVDQGSRRWRSSRGSLGCTFLFIFHVFRTHFTKLEKFNFKPHRKRPLLNLLNLLSY